MNLLVALLVLSFASFLLLLFVKSANVAKQLSLVLSIVLLGLSGLLVRDVVINDPSQLAQQIDIAWISTPDIHFHIGVDGISVWLVALSALISLMAVLLAAETITKRQNEFYAFLFLLEFALIGVFAAQDLFLFYTFFELTLVPSILMIGIWGGERRTYAAVKFFIYTLVGSILMLASIIFLYLKMGTGQLNELAQMIDQAGRTLLPETASWVFLGFFIAFAIKLALVPVHTWLPDTYDESPAPVPLVMSAVLMKMGTYGLIRVLPIFPSAVHQHADWIITLAIITIIYGALVAMVQANLRRLIGFSSISHIGFVVLGIFTFNQQGLDGAVFQMVAHGVSTGALFLLLGYLYQRRRSMEIKDFGGVATTAPGFAVAFLIAGLASIGLPGLSNFVGEYLVLQGTAQAWFPWAAFAAIGVILSACYFLWMYQRVFLGDRQPKAPVITDLTTREWIATLAMLLIVVYMGVGSQNILKSISAATARTVSLTKAGIEYRVQTNQPSVKASLETKQ